jgi:hypothetical protein
VWLLSCAAIDEGESKRVKSQKLTHIKEMQDLLLSFGMVEEE